MTERSAAVGCGQGHRGIGSECLAYRPGRLAAWPARADTTGLCRERSLKCLAAWRHAPGRPGHTRQSPQRTHPSVLSKHPMKTAPRCRSGVPAGDPAAPGHRPRLTRQRRPLSWGCRPAPSGGSPPQRAPSESAAERRRAAVANAPYLSDPPATRTPATAGDRQLQQLWLRPCPAPGYGVPPARGRLKGYRPGSYRRTSQPTGLSGCGTPWPSESSSGAEALFAIQGRDGAGGGLAANPNRRTLPRVEWWPGGGSGRPVSRAATEREGASPNRESSCAPFVRQSEFAAGTSQGLLRILINSATRQIVDKCHLETAPAHQHGGSICARDQLW